VSLTADYVPSITANTTYALGELYKTVTTDENNNNTEEFKDKEGHVVLKRNYDSGVAHDTYYVYDVYGNLTYVLPPKAEGDTSPTVLDELCYQYQYDYRNRLVAKKLPGKQWEFMVYDKMDRVVATGPAFSPFSDVTGSGWLITKYDVFNRVVYTGWLNSVQVNSTERSTMQQTQNNATTINESKQASGTIDTIAVNYSNNVAPTSFKLLTVSYYDDYAIPNVSGLATSVANQTVTTATKGLATGSWTRVPTTTAETKAETTSILYDAKFRPIRSYTTNYLGGYTYTDSKRDAFSGLLQYTVQKHKRTSGDSELTVKEVFTYSPQKRLLTHTHQINGGAEQLLADNTYDELGKLTSKKVGNTSAMPLQNVNYTYNIRGWLTQINEIKALQKGTDPKDLFGFTVNYNTVDGSTSAASPLYNGNIAETFWSTATDGGFVRNYGYKYDNLNRLKDATYQKSGQLTGMYNENLSYDKNGNILNLSRYGDRDEQYLPIQIDNLEYGYATNSNKLMSVVDNSNNTSGFKDGITTGDDYVYDANGNMTVDKNKNITSIVYNHLNLPTKIIFPTGNIVYIYTASGQKVQKVVTENTTVTTTDYLGGYQYQNTVLQYFPTVEGYVKNTANVFSYVYNYTDHLGNTRLSYTKDTTTGSLKILEENSYYPFGLKHQKINDDNFQPGYKYKYQGQERQDELGLNWDSFKFRNYDYAIGRFMSIDPLAEKYSYQSPYNFCENRVLEARELEGLEAFFIHGTESSPNRWTEKSVKTIMQLTNNKTSNTGFSWENKSGITNNSHDRYEAAKSLVDYIMANRSKGEGITLIGHSHGGNVSIQAAKMFYEKTGERIDIIAIATPAYNTLKDSKPLMEDPNTQLGHKAIRNFLSLFNTIDGVQGGLSGSNYFNELGGDGTYTRNAGVIDVSNFYSSYEFLDAHSFDVEHPSTIKDAIDKGDIKRPEYPGSAGSADDPKNRKETKE
jgi:RHS repeat-associated protein